MLDNVVSIILLYSYELISLFNADFKKGFEAIKLSLTTENVESDKLIYGVILIEDKRFFKHKGFDSRATLRAIYKTITGKRLEGGSTIEQQYVRLITNHREISISRKMREWLLAVKLSNNFSKNTILNSYLLEYVFRDNIKGIRNLVNKKGFNIKDLNKEEVATLVTSLKYPFIKENHPLFLKRKSIIFKILNK